MNTRQLRELTHRKPYSLTHTHAAWTSEVYYRGLLEDARLQIKLTGNWETSVGEQDTFLHILEYENYAGFDKATELIKNSKVIPVLIGPS